MKITHEEYREMLEQADERMKANNGHEFMTILKTRCIHCGASPRRKGKCGQWFQTFVSKLGDVMKEKGLMQ